MFIRLSWYKNFSEGGATNREGALIRRNTVDIDILRNNSLVLTTLQDNSFETTIKEGKIAVYQHFILFFPT